MAPRSGAPARATALGCCILNGIGGMRGARVPLVDDAVINDAEVTNDADDGRDEVDPTLCSDGTHTESP